METSNQKQIKIPCVYMRGGTSKGVLFHERDLPQDQSQWPEIFRKVMGSPDVKQIDGMGGTVSSTSKVAVIRKSQRPGVDVDYTFCQVDPATPTTDMSVNCGNLSSAVGPFAIDEGLVEAREPVTAVRVYNTNTQKVIEEHVRVEDGQSCVYGTAEIAGVPGTGSRIDMYFEEPAGTRTGMLFPTGKRREDLDVPGHGPVEVTIIDCSQPVVFVRAEALGLRGIELTELNQNTVLMDLLERIRAAVAVKLGFVERWEDARAQSSTAPDIVFISRPQSYVDLNGGTVNGDCMDLCVRALSMGAVHKAFPVTDSIAAGAAAKLAGTIVYDLTRSSPSGGVRLGHSSGIMEVEVDLDGAHVRRVGLVRTARRIMDGNVYIR